MSEQLAETIRPPQYIDEVEKAIGLRFFALAEQQDLIRTNPAALGEEVLAVHAAIYTGGLRLLAKARKHFNLPKDAPFQLTDDQWTELRTQYVAERQELIEQLTANAQVVSEPPEAIFPTTLRKEVGLGVGRFRRMTDEFALVMVTFKRRASSTHGEFYILPDEADRVRSAFALPEAAPDDVLARRLAAKLHTSRERLAIAAEMIGVSIDAKRGPKRWGNYITAIGAVALGEYFVKLEDLSRWRSVTAIAQAAGVDNDEVRAQATWNGFDDFYTRRRKLNSENRMVTLDYLPEDCAEKIIQQLSIIVPDEYLTVRDYALLRGRDQRNVSQLIEEHNLPLQKFTVRDQTYEYLDGATIYKLNHLLESFGRAPKGWKTMSEIELLVDAPRATIKRYMTGRHNNVKKTMRPQEGDGPAVPHYPPGFVRHIMKKIKPNGVPAGRTALKVLVERTGMTSTGLIAFLRREGVENIQVREGGEVANTYDNDELAVALPKLPKRYVPLRGISLKALAAYHKVTVNNMNQRLRKARGLLPEGAFVIGRYIKESGGTGSYYLKEELLAVGIDVPATPAFPAGERAYGQYGPARARNYQESKVAYRPGRRSEPLFELATSGTGEKSTAGVPEYTPGATLRRGPATNMVYARYVPPELASPKGVRLPQHRTETPGSWTQRATRASANSISVTEVLTRAEIVDRLGVTEQDIDTALEQIDPGDYQPREVEQGDERVIAYAGKLLRAIREQLVGVPLGYAQVLFGLSDEELGRSRQYLQHNGYEPASNDYFSPGAMDFLVNNIFQARLYAE